MALAVARLGYWRLAGGASSPELPIGPVLPGWFPGGVVVLPPPPPLNWLATSLPRWCPAGGADSACIGSPLRGSPRAGPLPLIAALEWAASMLGVAVMAIAAAFAPTLGATESGYPEVSPRLWKLRPATCARARVGCRCCWSFLYWFKRVAALFLGPESALGFRRLLLLVVPGLAPLMQAQRQQPAQRSGAAWLDRCQSPTKNCLVIAICR